MRKFSAIFFLVIFNLYNLGHLACLYFGPMYISNHWLEKVIHPDDERLQEFSIPFVLPPYTMDQPKYLPTNGSIILDGTPYRVVFKKHARDTVFFKVIVDNISVRFSSTMSDWIKTINDKSETSPGKQQRELKSPSVLKEYIVTETLSFECNFINPVRHNPVYGFSLVFFIGSIPTPPPEV